MLREVDNISPCAPAGYHVSNISSGYLARSSGQAHSDVVFCVRRSAWTPCGRLLEMCDRRSRLSSRRVAAVSMTLKSRTLKSGTQKSRRKRTTVGNMNVSHTMSNSAAVGDSRSVARMWLSGRNPRTVYGRGDNISERAV
jgi:hypothetical protein